MQETIIWIKIDQWFPKFCSRCWPLVFQATSIVPSEPFFFFYWSGSDTFCGGVELSLFHFPSPPSHGLSHIPWVMVLLTLGTTEADSHTDKSRYKGTKSRYKGTKLTASCQEQTKLHNSKNHLQVETSLLSVCAQSWSFEEQVRGCNKGEDAGQSGARQSGQSAQWAAEFNKNCGEF